VLWHFELADGIAITIFEEKESGRMLGSVRGVARTPVTDECTK
jgi:Lon protease-like protein